MAERVKDPVCGMQVEKNATKVLLSIWERHFDFSFCSKKKKLNGAKKLKEKMVFWAILIT